MAEYKFTQSQFDQISLLLKRRLNESREEQKRTRAKIRSLGFMISDYFNGFSELDFKKLLNNGTIEIINKTIPTKTLETKKLIISSQTIRESYTTKTYTSKKRDNTKDEHYVLDLCDKVLGIASSRQHKFDFLIGDPNSKGVAAKLPVDSFYEQLNLVVEYREKQHTESVTFFDKPDKLTVSGVHRGEQRKIYDERRRTILPQHGIRLIEISYADFIHDSQKRIHRQPDADLEIVKVKLDSFIRKKNNVQKPYS